MTKTESVKNLPHPENIPGNLKQWWGSEFWSRLETWFQINNCLGYPVGITLNILGKLNGLWDGNYLEYSWTVFCLSFPSHLSVRLLILLLFSFFPGPPAPLHFIGELYPQTPRAPSSRRAFLHLLLIVLPFILLVPLHLERARTKGYVYVWMSLGFFCISPLHPPN